MKDVDIQELNKQWDEMLKQQVALEEQLVALGEFSAKGELMFQLGEAMFRHTSMEVFLNTARIILNPNNEVMRILVACPHCGLFTTVYQDDTLMGYCNHCGQKFLLPPTIQLLIHDPLGNNHLTLSDIAFSKEDAEIARELYGYDIIKAEEDEEEISPSEEDDDENIDEDSEGYELT